MLRATKFRGCHARFDHMAAKGFSYTSNEYTLQVSRVAGGRKGERGRGESREKRARKGERGRCIHQ